MMLAKFRQRYPQGSLVSELIDIDRGTYIVGVSVIIDNIILATGLAGADQVEIAEDLARERAIAALMLDSHNVAHQNERISEMRISQDSLEPSTQISHQQDFPDSSITEIADLPETSSIQATQSKPITVPDKVSPVQPIKAESLDKHQPSSDDSANLFEGTLNSENNHLASRSSNVVQDYQSDESSLTHSPEEQESLQSNIPVEVNFNEIKHQTDLEIKRLGWTKDDGREFLKSRYGKRSRLQLTDDQLLEFLQYLASQPSPN